jgi:hypothetical protein
MADTGEGIAQQIYGGAATFGHYYSIAYFVLSGVIATVALGAGIYFTFFKTQPVWNKTVAKVLEAECAVAPGAQGQYSCRLGISFGTIPVNGVSRLINTILDAPTSTRMYQVGDQVSVYYDASDPSNVSFTYQYVNYKVIGVMALVAGLAIFVWGWFQYFIASTSKVGSAAVGAMGFWNLFR